MISQVLERKIIQVARSLINLPHSRYKHFSFICRRSKIVSIGWNRAFHTHTLAQKFGHRFNSIHSELDAIRNFDHPIRDIWRYKFVNIRVSKCGIVRNSRPCDACQHMLKAFGVNSVVHSTNNGFTEYLF